MSARIITAVFALLLAVASAAENIPDFQYGQRPPLSVFDPNGFLEPKVLKEISDPLAKIYKDQGIDVIVIVLPDLAGAPPEHVATGFAAAWCKSPIHSVVLHVPGRTDGPWIVPAGKLIDCIKPEILAQDVAEAKHRVMLEPTESGKIRAAATEAADMLRYWTGAVINRSEYIQTARTKIRIEQETKARRWRIATLMGAASAIPVVVGISMLFYLFRKPAPRRFPDTNPPRRLGAPHAGGNHAVADLGSSHI